MSKVTFSIEEASPTRELWPAPAVGVEPGAAGSFDNPGLLQYRRRDGQPENFRGFRVDDELKLCRLLHGKLGGFGASKDLIHEHGAASKCGLEIDAIGHQAASDHKGISGFIACGDTVLGGQGD